MLRSMLFVSLLTGAAMAAEGDSAQVKDVGPGVNILLRKVHGSTRKITLFGLLDGLSETFGFKVEVSASVAAKQLDIKTDEVTMAELFKKLADAAGCTFKVKDGTIRFGTEDELKAADAGTKEFKAFKKDEEPKLPSGNVNFRVSDFGFYIVDGYTEETTEGRIAAGSIIGADDLPKLIDNYTESFNAVNKASQDRCGSSIAQAFLEDLMFKPVPKCLGETAVRLSRVLKTTHIKVSQGLGDKKVRIPNESIRVYALLKSIKDETGCKLWWTPGDVNRPGSPDVPHVLWLYTAEELAKVQSEKVEIKEWQGEVTYPTPPAAAAKQEVK
jgi:hypothetical protein